MSLRYAASSLLRPCVPLGRRAWPAVTGAVRKQRHEEVTAGGQIARPFFSWIFGGSKEEEPAAAAALPTVALRLAKLEYASADDRVKLIEALKELPDMGARTASMTWDEDSNMGYSISTWNDAATAKALMESDKYKEAMGVLGPMITPGSIEVLALDTFRPAHVSPKQPDVGDSFVASMSTYTVTDPEGFEEFLKTIDLSALLSDDVYVMGVATSSTDPSMYCSMSSWASKEAQQAATESPAYAEIMGQAATYIDMDSLKREVHSVHMFQKSI